VSFLLDTDICSAHVKGNYRIHTRFIQYGGRLHISSVTLGELWARVRRAKASPRRLQALRELLKQVEILSFDETVADKFGEVRAWQLDRGLSTPDLDFLNAVTALVHGFTLVTRNTSDYKNVPALALDDWLAP
jgi:tRNA(fMet)-specific endonuclease VapC